MYFASRLQAGRMLASQISQKYAGEDCALVALTDGGVVVAAQISLSLHAVINMLLTDEINMPREPVALAGISAGGAFSYNKASYSEGEIDEMVSEYRGLIEQQKLEKMHAMNRTIGEGVLIRQDMLEGRHVILVADGMSSGFPLDLAIEYLKPVNFASLIVASPIASLKAVDRMHIVADDIFCLSVIEDYISTNHYYDTQDVPDHEVVLKTVERIVNEWKPIEDIGEVAPFVEMPAAPPPPEPVAEPEPVPEPKPAPKPEPKPAPKPLLKKRRVRRPKTRIFSRTKYDEYDEDAGYDGVLHIRR